MKIIKRGLLPDLRIWRGVCRTCKSEFEALESELNVQNDQRDGAWALKGCTECKTPDGISFGPTDRYEKRRDLGGIDCER